MKIYSIFYTCCICLFLAACTNNPSADNATTTVPKVNEDDLLMRLSSELSSDTSTQAIKDKNAILNYAIENMLDIKSTPSGLYYQITKQGTGKNAAWGDQVTAHYKGYDLNGNTFDSSMKRNKPIEFYVGNMVKGWNEGMELLNVGSKALFLLPSHLAYAERGVKNVIPPHTPLVFEVELLSLIEKKPPKKIDPSKIERR